MCDYDLLEESMEVDVESFNLDRIMASLAGITVERFMSNYDRAVKEFIESYDSAVIARIG